MEDYVLLTDNSEENKLEVILQRPSYPDDCMGRLMDRLIFNGLLNLNADQFGFDIDELRAYENLDGSIGYEKNQRGDRIPRLDQYRLNIWIEENTYMTQAKLTDLGVELSIEGPDADLILMSDIGVKDLLLHVPIPLNHLDAEKSHAFLYLLKEKYQDLREENAARENQTARVRYVCFNPGSCVTVTVDYEGQPQDVHEYKLPWSARNMRGVIALYNRIAEENLRQTTTNVQLHLP